VVHGDLVSEGSLQPGCNLGGQGDFRKEVQHLAVLEQGFGDQADIFRDRRVGGTRPLAIDDLVKIVRPLGTGALHNESLPSTPFSRGAQTRAKECRLAIPRRSVQSDRKTLPRGQPIHFLAEISPRRAKPERRQDLEGPLPEAAGMANRSPENQNPF
jgi:hypothetical protein